MWLLKFIEKQIDFRQYGGMKGNSITHYLIEFVNFILSNQDGRSPTAILACMVDFSKAFNRQNHSILITKLSDMGVPPWLLKIVIAFLQNRSMIVRYKGARSSQKALPGGGAPRHPVKRNLTEDNRIHLKYVDGVTLPEISTSRI